VAGGRVVEQEHENLFMKKRTDWVVLVHVASKKDYGSYK
jgi:hypothetical protein